MLPVGFGPTIPATARPQTYALDRAATGIGEFIYMNLNLHEFIYLFMAYLMKVERLKASCADLRCGTD
jgi:hypothetical protein